MPLRIRTHAYEGEWRPGTRDQLIMQWAQDEDLGRRPTSYSDLHAESKQDSNSYIHGYASRSSFPFTLVDSKMYVNGT